MLCYALCFTFYLYFLFVKCEASNSSNPYVVDLSEQLIPRVVATKDSGEWFVGRSINSSDVQGEIYTAAGSLLNQWNLSAKNNSADDAPRTVITEPGKDRDQLVKNIALAMAANLSSVNGVRLSSRGTQALALDGNHPNTKYAALQSFNASEPWTDPAAARWLAIGTDERGAVREIGGESFAYDKSRSNRIVAEGGDKRYILNSTRTDLDVRELRVGESVHIHMVPAVVRDQQTAVTLFKDDIARLAASLDANTKSVYLNDPEGKVDVLSTSFDGYKEDECPEIRFNNTKLKDKLKLDNDTIRVTIKPFLNETKHLVYHWPTCMTISFALILPLEEMSDGTWVPIDLRTLAAKLEMYFPDGYRLQCPEKFNCFPEKCIFRDLCNASTYDSEGDVKHGSFRLSFVEARSLVHQGCVPGQRKINFRLVACFPKYPNATDGSDAPSLLKDAKQFGAVSGDMMISLKLFKLKAPVQSCPDLFIANKLEMLGCRQITVSFTMKVFEEKKFDNTVNSLFEPYETRQGGSRLSLLGKGTTDAGPEVQVTTPAFKRGGSILDNPWWRQNTDNINWGGR